MSRIPTDDPRIDVDLVGGGDPDAPQSEENRQIGEKFASVLGSDKLVKLAEAVAAQVALTVEGLTPPLVQWDGEQLPPLVAAQLPSVFGMMVSERVVAHFNALNMLATSTPREYAFEAAMHRAQYNANNIVRYTVDASLKEPECPVKH